PPHPCATRSPHNARCRTRLRTPDKLLLILVRPSNMVMDSGDAAAASFLAAAAGRSAYWSIRSNLKAVGWPEEARVLIDTAWTTLEQVESAEVRVQQLLEERVG
ncbi:MAG: hypothetical protein ABI703_12115, partial [Gemmatimonadales bacterium]